MQLDFFNKKYSEDTVMARAQKYARRDPLLQQVIEIIYFDPYTKDEDIAAAISQGNNIVDASRVKLQLRPRAQQLIDQERAKNNTDVALPKAGTSQENEVATEKLPTIDELESQAVSIVMSAHSGVTLNAKIKQKVIFIFKTFAPLAVLCLTIPESYWVFTHLYAGEFAKDQTLPILTGIFAVLVDLGYLYLTVLLEMNKEAMFKRRRAGLLVEDHEEKAVRLQSVLWWCVALMDVLAQFVFLYSATHGSTFFDQHLVIVLAGVRVTSLFITMFVVSFAGTELMTDVDVVANEQVERAEKVGRVLGALGTARERQMRAKLALENMIADQDLRREGESFLKEMYKDAREDAKRTRDEMRRRRNDDDGAAGVGARKKI